MATVKSQQSKKPDKSAGLQPPLTKFEFLQFLTKVTRPIKPSPADQGSSKT